MSDPAATTLDHATAIVVAYLARHEVPPAELPALVAEVRVALDGEATASAPAATAPVPKKQTSRRGRRPVRRSTDDPAVPITESVTPATIASLKKGQRFRALERHVRSLSLTPTAYRRRRGLPKDYPMAAPNYAAFRSGVGRALGRRELEPIAVSASREPRNLAA